MRGDRLNQPSAAPGRLPALEPIFLFSLYAILVMAE